MSDDVSRPRRRGRPPAANRGDTAQVQSLARGLTLLRLLSDHNGLSLAELAERSGLPLSTAHRLLNTLAQDQFVHQDSGLGQWFIGLGAFQVGNAFLAHRDLVVSSRAGLRRLRDNSGETANLSLLHEGQVVYIAQAESRDMLRMLAPIGGRAAAHASGAGKAILAYMPAEEVQAYIQRWGLDAITEHTLNTPESFAKALNEARSKGYALDLEEHAIGLHCCAAPVFNEYAEPVAALSISGPAARLNGERLTRIAEEVADTAVELSLSIGGRVPEV